MESAIQTVSKTSLWVGRIISTLVVLFLLFDAVASGKEPLLIIGAIAGG